eukprot:scaffold21813_cov149-Isochrysis_galbana.AAC.3
MAARLAAPFLLPALPSAWLIRGSSDSPFNHSRPRASPIFDSALHLRREEGRGGARQRGSRNSIFGTTRGRTSRNRFTSHYPMEVHTHQLVSS